MRQRRTSLLRVRWTLLILIEASSLATWRGKVAATKNVPPHSGAEGGDLMRFYTKQHQYYCGIDLHARRMYTCALADEPLSWLG
jgi:hypothetical protein